MYEGNPAPADDHIIYFLCYKGNLLTPGGRVVDHRKKDHEIYEIKESYWL
jgi:hypothetical protein